MRVHRLTPRKYKKTMWSGYPLGQAVEARWNPDGCNLLYTSEHPALAVLEVTVHASLPSIVGKYSHGLLEIPETKILTLSDHLDLPEDWQKNQGWTQAIGEMFIEEQLGVALKVPSVLLPDCFNFLVNPVHPDFEALAKEIRDPLIVDERFKS